VTVNGDFVTISGIDEATTELDATQEVITGQCIDEDLQGEPFIFECGYTRMIFLREGANVELETASLEFLCGPVFNFEPWSYADYSGHGIYRLTVLDAPDPDLIGNTYATEDASLNLIELGKYILELTLWYNDGELCEDSAVLCVLICDAGEPAAPEVSPFCVGETVQLAGTVPDDICANSLWTQISGPGITFVNGSVPTDISPFITVDDPGEVCIEYNYRVTHLRHK